VASSGARVRAHKDQREPKAEVDEFAQQIAATAEHRHIFTVDRYERTYAISPIDRKQIRWNFANSNI